jgi:hypothetical protein
MKTDLYTKAVLTVIAASLVWMCVNGATPVTLAQGQPQAQPQAQAQAQAKTAPAQPTPVVLVNEKGIPIYTQQGIRMNLGAQPLPVTVNNNAPLPVSVRALQQGSEWDPIMVHVLREPPTQKPIP